MNGANNDPFREGPFQDFRMLLIVLIIASLILNLMEIATRTKPVEEEELGNGIIFKDKHGEYYVRYNITEQGLFGIKYPIEITFPMNKNHTDFLKYLLANPMGNPMANPTANPENNSTCILSWWKHGHAIKGITNITPLFKAPEPAYIFFADEKKWETSKLGKFSERKKFKRFAQILYNGSIKELREFAQTNNCTRIAIFKEDLYDFMNIHEYITKRMKTSEKEIQSKIKDSLLYQLNAREASSFDCKEEGLEIVYQDNYSRLFKVC